MATVQVIALQDMRGKQAQLADGPPAFALKPRLGQAAFLGSDFGDRLGAGLDFVGDGVQEGGAGFSGAVAIRPERLFRGFAGLMHQIGCANSKSVRRAVRRIGLKGLAAVNPGARDQVFSVGRKAHGLGPSVQCWGSARRAPRQGLSGSSIVLTKSVPRPESTSAASRSAKTAATGARDGAMEVIRSRPYRRSLAAFSIVN